MTPRKIPVTDRFLNKVSKDNTTGCWIWTAAKFTRGYGAFKLNGKQTKANRTAWTLFNGPIPSGLCVLHKCDNPLCVNPNHLWLGTEKDNSQDMFRKNRDGWAAHPNRRRPVVQQVNIQGKVAFGERSGKARLKTLEVLEIRRLFLLGVRQYILAKMFLSSPKGISHIVRFERRTLG